jgi:hypothetical protein
MLALQIRLEETETAALDSYRRRQMNPPTRPAAVRELARRVLVDGEPVETIIRDHTNEERSV